MFFLYFCFVFILCTQENNQFKLCGKMSSEVLRHCSHCAWPGTLANLSPVLVNWYHIMWRGGEDTLLEAPLSTHPLSSGNKHDE